MCSEYPVTQLYIVFAISITFLGGVVLSDKANISWKYMLAPLVFVIVSWGNIIIVLAEKFPGMEFYRLEMGVHHGTLLIFFISFVLIILSIRAGTGSVFS